MVKVAVLLEEFIEDVGVKQLPIIVDKLKQL